MQEDRKKFTVCTKKKTDLCEICIRREPLCILFFEVRNHEGRRKKADPLGNGRSQASGDPLGAHGAACAQYSGVTASEMRLQGSVNILPVTSSFPERTGCQPAPSATLSSKDSILAVNRSSTITGNASTIILLTASPNSVI